MKLSILRRQTRRVIVYGPAGLTLLRLMCAPALVGLARRGALRPCGTIMGAMIVADVADGVLARRIGNRGALRLQRRLDGIADLALYMVAPLCAVWGRPGLLKREARCVALLIGAQLASLISCLLKFRKLPRYHTEFVRWSSGAMGVALAVRIACDRLVWPSRAVVGIAALAHFEAMAVTLLLDVYHDPIPTAWCVGARRRDVADGRR